MVSRAPSFSPKTFSAKKLCCFLFITLVLASCQNSHTDKDSTEITVAPGAPGQASVWAYSGKTGIGTSYEAYHNGGYTENAQTGKVSKVWFSIAQGILTETMYGLIHEAQIKEMQFLIKGNGFLDEEKVDTENTIHYLHTDEDGRPLSLAYKVITRDRENKYEIEKHFFTDPERNSLMMRVKFRANEEGIQPYLTLNPHMGNTGEYDKAWKQGEAWHAIDQHSSTALSLVTNAKIEKSSVGFVGASDGLSALKAEEDLQIYNSTGPDYGNVAITLALPKPSNKEAEWLFVVGFGNSTDESQAAAKATLNNGYTATLNAYNGKGESVGWEDYLQSLPELQSLSPLSKDNGHLLYTSAMVLKAQEDKTHAGALIASLSNPWGDTKSASTSKTGYKAVWPRDFYQVAMAMLALGDTETPKVAFEYLRNVQVTDKTPGFSGDGGWFLQKTHVDGQLEWFAVQLDQTAMPIMLGWRLWKSGVLSEDEAKHWYTSMLKPAAEFLTNGGNIHLDWNNTTVTPPFTQQERWEEQQGYSPSSMAALISGLVCAAELATLAGDQEAEKRFLAAADKYSADLEPLTYTTKGSLNTSPANGQYYLRITRNQDPNDHAALGTANAQVANNESEILDAGFLELVRYGVRSADSPYVVESLPELDNTGLEHDLRVKYMFRFEGEEGEFPGWRRYGRDGYGEDTQTGLAYGAINDQMSEHQRGRVWPFFTGERATYEIARASLSQSSDKLSSGKLSETARAKIRQEYVKAMEMFANDGLMLPEQVWDGVGNNEHYQFTLGEGTNSATPLAWTHAEYIKLLRSLRDSRVWDRYTPVEKRYASKTQK